MRMNAMPVSEPTGQAHCQLAAFGIHSGSKSPLGSSPPDMRKPFHCFPCSVLDCAPGLSWFGRRILLAALLSGVGSALRAHVIGDAAHDVQARLFAREFAPVRVALLRHAVAESPVGFGGGGGAQSTTPLTEMFGRFAPAVRVRAVGDVLLVESNGLPAHPMMVGITAWQQQVPLPQPYTGANAWRIPLKPVPSANPVSIKGRFLRGAIALAANGIPIFNPQNNRGEISAEIGELDQWGGHCGRADDYHYHVAPLHLQALLGERLPVAYALDGYAIYGLTEPDGAPPQGLDAFNGHETAALGYHYHASKKYPYVNGGFHGVVVEKDEQVDPQPRAQGVRPALTGLRGAKITAFEGTPGSTPSKLSYTVNGRPASVAYTSLGGGQWKFQFANADGSTKEETYRASERGGGGGGGGGRDGKKKGGGGAPKGEGPPREPAKELGSTTPEFKPKRTGNFSLRSSAVGADGVLPVEFTGDGASISPPLEWSGVPEGTKNFAVIMHHVAPDGEMKWYWTLYNLPASLASVPKDARDLGTLGNNSVTRRAGYAPPHSKGPGAKTYVLTAYALAAPVAITTPPAEVNCAVLLAAMKDLILDSAELKVTYTRPEGASDDSPAGKKKGKRV